MNPVLREQLHYLPVAPVVGIALGLASVPLGLAVGGALGVAWAIDTARRMRNYRDYQRVLGGDR